MLNDILDLKGINTIGLVVKDVDRVAEQLWEKFGIGPWTFIEFGPNVVESTYYGEPCSYLLKIAEAKLGPITLELTQPVSGPSPHMDFLKSKGEGMHHLGFMIESPEEIEKMKALGCREISTASGIGKIEDSYTAYFDTVKDIGCMLELSYYPQDGSDIEVYKIYPDPEDDIRENNRKLNITRIDQIAFVVKDADKTAEYFWQKLGLGPWVFSCLGPGLDKRECYGKPCEFSYNIAGGQIGPLMVELIQPLSGETPHTEFLKTRGEGLFNMGVFIEDIAQLEEMKNLGYQEIECGYGIGGEEGFAVFFDTEKDIGAVIGLLHYDGTPSIYKIYPEPDRNFK